MRYITAIVLAMTLVAAEKDLAGVYVGKWSGASGTAGDCRMDLKLTGGKLTPNVMFTMGSTEVKTTVTHVAVDGLKIEMKYEFDLGGARLESTAHATLKGDTLEGTYTTKSVADGSRVDEGQWKAQRSER